MKSKNILYKIVFIVIMIFICLYSISQSGYINKVRLDKTISTEEQIDSFEKDIDNHREIINVYHDKENDYSNIFSEFGIKISNGIYTGACKLFDFICYLFNYLFN